MRGKAHPTRAAARQAARAVLPAARTALDMRCTAPTASGAADAAQKQALVTFAANRDYKGLQ